MSDLAVRTAGIQWAWLRNSRFDLVFILGISAFAICVGLVVVWQPFALIPILIVDLWFLGYHHVIATYTRLCFDRKSFSEHWHLLVVLLPAVALGTLAAAYFVGLWVIVSIYLYWQWFHYARQSWGISRAYRSKQRGALYEDGWLDQAIFYSLPVLGILYRSYQDPGEFLFMQLKVIPVSLGLVQLAAAVTFALLAFWLFRRVLAWREGRLAEVHTLYMLTHFGIFAVGYLIISDITVGWLVINIWHNAQYILFVWMFNNGSDLLERARHAGRSFLCRAVGNDRALSDRQFSPLHCGRPHLEGPDGAHQNHPWSRRLDPYVEAPANPLEPAN